MASRAVNYWRSVVGRVAATRSMTTATAPRMKPYAPAASDFVDHHQHGFASRTMKGDFMPVCVSLGMILLSLTFGVHTAKQQLAYSPNVRVNKRRRETIPEVVEPERVETEADRFINKSLFRRVAHVQDVDSIRGGITDPTRGRSINQPRRMESLMSVCVDPQGR